MLAAALVAVLALVPADASAADYWVKNGGSNAADGLSVATAWATLGHAANRVGPGDTVHVLDGSYQGFYLTRSGTAGAPITFAAAGPNVRITSDNPITPDGINLEGSSHVVIDGFVVDGRTRAGVRAVLGEHVTVRNCRLGHNRYWGILTGFVDDFVAEGNEAHHSQIEHGIYVSNSPDRPIVRNNVVYSNRGNGLHFNGDASLGGDGLVEDALVEGNVIYDNGVGGGSGINMDGGVRGTIRNNLLYGNHASGISLYRIDAGGGAKDNLVVNNTIVNAADGRWCVNISGGSTGNTLRNNILYNAHSFRGVITIDASSRPGFSSDRNSLMSRFSTDGGGSVISFAAWQALGYDANSFLATPASHFLVPGSDHHLLATSPAVDAGDATLAPSIDLDGNPRPVGAGVDLGAYELQLAECGDGGADPGEQCGEPGLACDACSACAACTCQPLAPVCGDGVVCGAESCESNDDCSGGAVCDGCACVAPAACASGIAAEKPVLMAKASPPTLRLRGEAVIPKQWLAVDPAQNGVRVVVDAVTGGGGFDVQVPGGASWKVNAPGTRWTYVDPTASAGGVQRVVIVDRSSRRPGLVAWRVQARGGSFALPPAAAARSAILLGGAEECALTVWNGPGEARPRCDGDASKLTCR